jgi:hypothetical protein
MPQFPTLRQADAGLISDAFPFDSVQVGERLLYLENLFRMMKQPVLLLVEQ